jgi:aromatic-L-amino-acid decarboxylase
MDYRREAHALVDWIADYLETIESRRIVPDVTPGDIIRQLPANAPEQGEPFERIFADFERVIMPGVVQWQHPNWFAYFASNNSPASMLGEMLSSGLAVHAMSWVTSPAATELEQVTVDWVRQLLGFPDHLRGVIQDTASSATLAAVIAGRDAAWRRAGREASIVFYASNEAHSSVAKAARLAGFGPDQVRSVATDASLAMLPDSLDALIREDLAAGRVPAVVVATVGSTSSAAVDPVRAIGEIARRHGAFYHVDAAWAGSAAIVPERRAAFDGLELADSVVTNPHKWMGVNFDCTLHFIRDLPSWFESFALTPEYLKSAHDADVVNYRDWGIQLGRRFRALKLWFVLRSDGAEVIRERIREHIRLGELFASWVDADPDFERMAPASFALVCFRHRPAGLEDSQIDDHNRRLLSRINATGRIHMIGTTLRGRFVIRMAIGQRNTAERNVREAWDVIRAVSRET